MCIEFGYSAKFSSVGQGRENSTTFHDDFFSTAKMFFSFLCSTYQLAGMNFIPATFGFSFNQAIYRIIRWHLYQCVSKAFYPSLMYIPLTRHYNTNHDTAKAV